MYTVYGSVNTRALRVLWALEEMQQFYQYIPCAPQSELARSLNITGKVPVLVDGDAAISDSVAIMTYLADKHGMLTHPAGSLARAKQDAMTFWLIDEFETPLWLAAKHSFILPPERRVPEIKPVLRWEFAQAVEVLARWLGDKPYLTGDQMTIVDMLAAHCGAWATVAKFPIENTQLASWMTKLRSRAAFTRALANDLPG
jgi:glutathione S-transferase